MQRFEKAFQSDLRSAGNGPIRKALKQWGARYRSFAQERFDQYSKGGGDWPPLSLFTILGRRKGPRKRKKETKKPIVKHAILRDTGTLFAALAPTFSNKPGAVEEQIPFGIRVGYGGPIRHGKGAATIAEIAAAHQTGGPKLPQRKIIVDPQGNVIAAMTADMQRAIDSMDK